MHPTTTLSTLLALASLTLSALAQNTTATPILTHAFTAKVTVGKPVAPIPVPAGLTIVEPVTGGSIAGPLFNGKISGSGGSSVIGFNTSLTFAIPNVQVWGTTDDGEAFFVQGTGIGKQGAQFARMIIQVGGKYADIANEFVLASFTDNDANPPTESTIEAWVVNRIA